MDFAVFLVAGWNWLLANAGPVAVAAAAVAAGLFFLRAFRSVYVGLARSGLLARAAVRGAGSYWVLIPVGLAAGIVAGCAFTDWVDAASARRVAADARAAADDLRTRARARLVKRIAELLRTVDPAAATDFETAAGDGGRAAEWTAPTARREGAEGGGAWWAVRRVFDPAAGKTAAGEKKAKAGFELVDAVRGYNEESNLPAGEEEKKKEVEKRRDELRAAFGSPPELAGDAFDYGLAVVRRLYAGEPPEAPKLTRGDVGDARALFGFTADGRITLSASAAAFVRDPWATPTREDGTARPNLLDRTLALAEYTEPVVPRPGEPGYWADLYHRLGTSYQEPSTRQVARAFATAVREVFPDEARLSDADRRFLLIALGYTLLPPADGADKNDPPAVDRYEFPGTPVGELLARKFYPAVQLEVCDRIEKRSSGNVDYALGVTYVNARAMTRGPIQLVTLVTFFWGVFVLVVKVFALDLLPQMSYLVFATRRDQALDRFDLTWVEVWLCQVGSADNPATRQLVEADSRPHDLFPFLLRRLLLAMQAGRSADEASGVIDQAAADWRADRVHEDLFFDFVAWALPSLGFLGTVVGIGQGMALANKVLTPDPDVQAQTISLMTQQLGTAFYTTLVALACAIPFTLGYYLGTALKGWQVGQFKRLAGRFMARCVEWQKPADPSPTRPIPARRPNRQGGPTTDRRDLELFLAVISTLAAEINPTGIPLDQEPPHGPLPRVNRWGRRLSDLLVHGGVFQPGEAEAELAGLWAFSRLWRATERLPDRWVGLAQLLYTCEVRPSRVGLRPYGLAPGPEAPGRSIRVASGYWFEQAISSLCDDFVRTVFKPEHVARWRHARRRAALQSDAALRERIYGLTPVRPDFGDPARWVRQSGGRGAQAIRLLTLFVRDVPPEPPGD